MTKRPLNPKFGLAVCLLAAVIILGQGVCDTYRCARSTAWPHTTGTVKESVAGPGRGRRKGVRAVIAFDYTADGNRYTSTRVRFGGYTTFTLDAARGVAARYPKRAGVNVYYDPANPAQAVLEPGLHAGLLGFVALALLFAGTGYLVGIYFPRKMAWR